MPMQPIRWDNVGGQSLAGVGQTLESAQRSFNGAFDNLGGMIKSSEAVNNANWDQTKTNNTNAALAAINQYATPEDYQAALKDGTINNLITAHGAQIDQAAVRAAADARLSTLQQRAEQTINYNHAITDEKTAPLVEAYRTAALNKDQAGMDAAMTQYTAQSGRHPSELAAFADQRQRELVLRDQADQTFGLNQKKGNAEIAHWNAQDLTAAAQLSIERANLDLHANEQRMAMLDHLEAQKAQVRAELGALADEQAGSTGGAKAIFDEVAKIKDPATQDNARRVATQLIATPGMTTGAAIAAVMGINQKWYIPDAVSRSTVRDNAGAIVQTPGSIQQQESTALRTQMAAQSLRDIAKRQSTVESQLGTSAFPGGSSVAPAPASVVRIAPAPGQQIPVPVPVPTPAYTGAQAAADIKAAAVAPSSPAPAMPAPGSPVMQAPVSAFDTTPVVGAVQDKYPAVSGFLRADTRAQILERTAKAAAAEAAAKKASQDQQKAAVAELVKRSLMALQDRNSVTYD